MKLPAIAGASQELVRPRPDAQATKEEPADGPLEQPGWSRTAL